MARKYFSAFDKELFELFSDEDDDKEKKEEEEEFAPQFMGDVPQSVLDTSSVKSRSQEDLEEIGDQNFFELDDGTLATNSADPAVIEKVKSLNTDANIAIRQLEKGDRAEPAEPISSVEKVLLGTSPMDSMKDIPFAERIGRKTVENVNRAVEQSARGAAAGLTRGSVILPQISQLVNKYGIGTLENAVRGAFGDGMVDYDKLFMANTSSKAVSEVSEKFIKSVDAAMDVKNLGTSAKILMYVTDFAVPVNLPGKAVKATKLISKVTSDVYKAVTNTSPYFQRLPGFQPVDPIVKSFNEQRMMNPLYKELDNAKVDKNWEAAAEINEKILKRRASLLEGAIKNIRAVDGNLVGKTWDRIKEPGSHWYDFTFKRRTPKNARMSVLAADKQVPLDNLNYMPIKGAKEKLDNRLVFETWNPEEKAFNLFYKKLMQGQSVVSAGAIAGTWDSYFEGTEYRDLSYLMGLTSIIANPTSTMRLIDAVGSFTFGSKVGVQNWKIKWGQTQDSAGMEIDRVLSLPSLVHGIGKFWASRNLKEGEFLDLNTATFAKKARAMAMGVPFYKIMFSSKNKFFGKDGLDVGIDDTTKINAAGMTQLDALTTFSTKEFKSLEKYSATMMENLPEEYIKSYELLVKIGTDNAERLRNSDYGDKTKEFMISIDQLAAGVRMNAFGGILNQAHRNEDFKTSMFGLGKRDASNILNIFRTHQQELQDQVGYIKQAMEDLVGGFSKTSDEFQSLKVGADKIVAKLNSNIKDFSDQISVLSQQAKVVGSLTNDRAMKVLVDKDTGFNLKETHGVGEEGKGSLETIGRKQQEFADKVDEYIANVYKQAEANKDAKFKQMDEALQGKNLDADEYIDELENLRMNQIDDFAEISTLLTNKADYIKFGTFGKQELSGKGKISYKNDLDAFIRFSRYKGLLNKSEDNLEDVANDLAEESLNLQLASQKIPHSKDATGSFDLKATLDNMPEHLESIGNMSKEDYLRVLLSNVTTSSKTQRIKLNSLFDHTMNASDMHTLRKNHSGWAWRNRFTKPEASNSLYNSSKKLDEIFESHNITEVAEANKEYTAFKRTWHENFIGKKILETVDEQGDFIKNTADPRDLLTNFLKASDSKKSKELLDEMFKNLKDNNGNITDISSIKAQVMKDLDTTFGYEIVTGRLLRGNYTSQIAQIASLRQNKLISEDAANKAKQFLEMTTKESEARVSKAIYQATQNLDNAMKRMSDTQLDNIKQSISVNVKKIDDTNQLFDFLFPPSKADTYARQSVGASDEVTDIFGEVKSLAKDTIDEIEKAGQKPSLDAADVQKTFDKNFPIKNREEVTGARFDIFLEELFGVSRSDIINRSVTASQKKQLASFRDVLVSTLIKKSENINSTRKSMLDLSFNEKMKGIAGQKVDWLKASINNKLVSEGVVSTGTKGFELDSDINIVEMMTLYENMGSSLKKIDAAIGSNKSFVDDLDMMFSNLIAIKGQVPELTSGDMSSIPRALSYSAALSRVYSGMRGVVSWRYLATEQIVREQQRAKHMMLHTVMSDPNFVRNLGLIIDNKPIKNAGGWVKQLLGIMAKPAFSRAVTFDPDKDDSANYDPTPNEVVKYLRSFFNVRDLQETEVDIPFTDISVGLPGFSEPKDITKGNLALVEDESLFRGYKLGIEEDDDGLSDLDLGEISSTESQQDEDSYYENISTMAGEGL